MQKRTAEAFSNESETPYIVRRVSSEEISLVDLVIVIRRRWPWLIAGLLLGIVAAAAYAFLTVPVYESRASIQIGRVPELGTIEDINGLSFQLIDQYGPSSANGTEERMPHLKRAVAESGRNNILKLIAIGYSAADARAYLNSIINDVIRQHEQIYANATDPWRQRLEAIDSQRAFLKDQIAQLGELVDRLKQSHPVQASLVAIERGRLYTELNEIERDRVALREKVSHPYSSPSRVVVRAAGSGRPTMVSTVTALLLGALGGLVLGLLAVFGVEVCSKARSGLRSNRNRVA